jgi:hypothetical protein
MDKIRLNNPDIVTDYYRKTKLEIKIKKISLVLVVKICKGTASAMPLFALKR